MTDQKLVDELEKALRDEAYDGGMGTLSPEEFRELVRTLAVTAGKVVDELRAPTDNEKLIEEAARAILASEGIGPEEDGTYWGEATWPNAVKDARTAFAVFEKAHTPTDDEREARRPMTSESAWDSASDESRDAYYGEVLKEIRGAQAEPSDAQVEAAARALGNRHSLDWSYMSEMDRDWERGDARAALRAASAVTEPLIECSHWSPGKITLRRGCTACAAVTEQGENRDA